jgi:hypothetical protein
MKAVPDFSYMSAERRIEHRNLRALRLRTMSAAEIRDGMTRAYAGDPVTTLKEIAEANGATGAWTPLTDPPAERVPTLRDQWECSENGHTILYCSMTAGEREMFNGVVFGDDNEPVVSLRLDGIVEKGARTFEDVKRLKDDWEKDPIFDLEETEGFEAHRDELLQHRIEKQRRWADEAEEAKQAEINAKQNQLGVESPELAFYVIALEKTIATMQAEIADLKSR